MPSPIRISERNSLKAALKLTSVKIAQRAPRSGPDLYFGLKYIFAESQHYFISLKRIKYALIIFIIKVFVFTVPLFPRKMMLGIFAFLGRISARLLKKERAKAAANLRIAFPNEKSDEELNEMAEMVFVHQAKNLADYAHAINVTTREGFSKYADIVGEEHLKKAYGKGKGVLCLVCHTGSWEFSAITPSILGYKTTAVSKGLKNPKLNEMVVGFRQKRGLNNLNRGDTYPLLIESLKKGECLIIMIDQDTRVKSVFVDFFGKPAYTPIGAAMLALDTEAAVVPMAMRRMPNGKHQFTIKPEVPIQRTDNRNVDLIENTKVFSKVIEDYIRLDPVQWVWMHKRWKTKPEDIQELVKRGVIRDTSLYDLQKKEMGF
jgi:KDO2-lipid IV(A) lauroyltransferase